MRIFRECWRLTKECWKSERLKLFLKIFVIIFIIGGMIWVDYIFGGDSKWLIENFIN